MALTAAARHGNCAAAKKSPGKSRAGARKPLRGTTADAVDVWERRCVSSGTQQPTFVADFRRHSGTTSAFQEKKPRPFSGAPQSHAISISRVSLKRPPRQTLTLRTARQSSHAFAAACLTKKLRQSCYQPPNNCDFHEINEDAVAQAFPLRGGHHRTDCKAALSICPLFGAWSRRRACN
jgi:hypothetical protein